MSAGVMRRGFSLIELTVVVAILGILAALVLPRFANANEQATTNAVSAITRNVQLKISEHYAKHGSYPTDIDGDWFMEGTLPPNPYDPNGGTSLIVQDIADKVYLQNKVAGSHIYWYNRATGAFHIRIPDQGSSAANLAYYNQVNHSDAQSMSQTER
ncbi:MAG: type II secretion system protein [Planctomycetota bacterium]